MGSKGAEEKFVVGVEAMVSVDDFEDFLPVKTSQTDITTCYEGNDKEIEGCKLQRHKGRQLNRRRMRQ